MMWAVRMVEDRVAGRTVLGAIDVPGSPVAADRLAVRGWALGKDSPVARVEVWLDGRAVGRAGLGRPRPDLIGVVGNGDAELSGFELRLDGGRLGRAPGAIDVAVRVTLLDGTAANLAPATIPVA